MARTQKPQWEKGWSGFYTFKYLSDEDFKELAGALGVADINKDIRSRIQSIIRDYASDKHSFEQRPRLAQLRAALKQVSDSPDAFRENLDRLDSRASWEITTRINSPEKHLTTADIQSAAEQALQDLEMDTGGRPKNKAALRALISRLRAIFEELTGRQATITWHQHKERYQGVFYAFVLNFLELIDPEEVWSNFSLGQQIKAALRPPRRP